MQGTKFLELVIPSVYGVDKTKEAEEKAKAVFTRVSSMKKQSYLPLILKTYQAVIKVHHRQVKIEELIKDNVVAVATASYNKVKELMNQSQLKIIYMSNLQKQ